MCQVCTVSLLSTSRLNLSVLLNSWVLHLLSRSYFKVRRHELFAWQYIILLDFIQSQFRYIFLTLKPVCKKHISSHYIFSNKILKYSFIFILISLENVYFFFHYIFLLFISTFFSLLSYQKLVLNSRSHS